MRMKVKHFTIITLLLFIIGGLINPLYSQAASAEVTLDADNKKVTKGENIFVYVTISSKTSFGDFEANLTYNDDILEYKGGSSVISGGSGFLRISDMGVLDGDTTRKYTLKFEAIDVGMCTIAFSDRAMVYDFASGYEMSVSSNELTVNVEAPVTASNNAYLKSLKISPSQLTPEFNKDTYEYNTNVSNETESLIVTALPEDEKATVSITGNEKLAVGENKVTVSVLAESGDIIKYTINVTRDEKIPEAEPTLTPTPTLAPELPEGDFEIMTYEGETYAVFHGVYKLVEPSSDELIPAGYKKGSLIVAGVSVTAYLPENQEDSEFLLLYAMNEMGDAGFYRYDRVEKTMQRYVPDSQLITDTVDSDSDDNNKLEEQYNANLKKAAVVIAVLSSVIVVMIVVIVRLSMYKKRRRR